CTRVHLIAAAAFLICLWPADPVRAQSASDCAQEQDPDLRAQCEEVSGQRANQDRAQPPAPLAAIPRSSQPGVPAPGPPQVPPSQRAPSQQAPSQSPPAQTTTPAQPQPPRPFHLQGKLREACAVLLAPSSGAPGEKGVILVANNRREIIDR